MAPRWPDGSPAADGWTIRSSRPVVRDRHLHLDAEACVTRTGAVIDPYWVIRYPDWVLVVALTPGDALVCVRQWRHGARAWVLEPPAGAIDPGDADACATARRELLEETGYDAAGFRVVATPWSDPAHNSNRLHVVLAEAAVPVAAPRREPGEDMETVLLPLAEALAGLPEGLFGQGLHVGGLLLALRAAGRVAF